MLYHKSTLTSFMDLLGKGIILLVKNKSNRSKTRGGTTMYVVAVKGTKQWYYVKSDIDAAKKVTELLEHFSQEQIILAEELEVSVINGAVEVIEIEDEEDNDCGCDH